MTDTNETPENQPEDTSTESKTGSKPAANNENKSANKRKDRKVNPLKRVFWYVVLVIIIATIAWLVIEKPYQSLELNLSDQANTASQQAEGATPNTTPTDPQIETLSQQVQALEEQLAALSEQLNNNSDSQQTSALKQQLTSLESSLNQQRQQLEALTRQLPQQQAQQITQWRLFEAKQTVSAAARLLWGADDRAAALALLNIADVQLAGIETAAAIQIRQLLAKDIARVQAYTEQQNNQVALTLAGLHQRIQDLPNRVTEKRLDASNEPVSVSDNADDWRSNLAANWDDFLTTFIRIQPSTANAEPLLTTSQRQAMSLRLDLLLTMAQHAAIKNNRGLLKQYIDQAVDLIAELKGQTEASKDVLTRLQKLRNHSSTQQPLTTLASLDALSQVVNQGGLQ